MTTARPRRTAGRPRPRPGHRARTVRGLAVAGITALTVIGLGVPAGAVAVRADPAPAGASSPGVVLIVHAAGDAAAVQATVADVRASATRSAIGVRHAFPGDHAFSVEVPAAGRAAAEAALRATPGVTGIETPVRRSFFAMPNDPDFASEATYLNAVDAPAAWAVTHGSRSVRIAVVDTGIDVRHPDLAHKIVGTYDAHDGGTTITDDVGHGTFVAGVAAADTDNGLGIAGAGYDTTLLGVKIAAPDGSLSIDDEIAGINWAVRNHADIINLSLGGTEYSAAEKAAVENAVQHGVLVVAAAGNAGNAGNAVKQYPAAYAGVVAVGAIDPATHRRASFSSYGSWVTLGAPGVDILSTTPTRGSSFFPSTAGYSRADGTSFSAPLVAGEAALLKSRDPGATVPQLRQALAASAHGYTGQGLGAGQADFAAALAHLPPTAAPTSASVTGQADRITLVAHTTSPAVEFRIDSGGWTAPVPATDGSAHLGYDSWGISNADHVLHVRACSTFGECGAGTADAPFVLANTAPEVLTPEVGTTSTGRFTVTAEHPSGGGARLLIDGATAGFDATSPYSFPVDGSGLTDGDHRVGVVSCSVSGRYCYGPASTQRTITTESLHPVITALTHPAISPNGDRSGDTATLRFTLPDPESVTVRTLDREGRLVGSAALGTLARGPHTWTWRGLDARGARLPDGNYAIAVSTASPAGAYPALAGYAATLGIVDTVAPRLTRPAGDNVLFYPVHDGYRDTFAPGVTVSTPGVVTLTIRSASGAVARTLSAARGTGRTTLIWNGHDRRGRIVKSGTYRWQYSVTDAAGNRSTAANERVRVSGKKLVARVAYVQHRGSTYHSAGGTDSCSTARKRASGYQHGIALRNACPAATGDFAYAAYRFTVPGAIRYSRVAFQVYGRSQHRPSQLSVAVDRTDGGLEIPAYVKVSRSGSHWHSIASVPAAGHIGSHRGVSASVLLTGAYRGTNDFDVRWARLRVSYTALG